MTRWIFVTSLMSGTYKDKSEKVTTGVSMYLGVEPGETAEAAFRRLYNKHGYEFHMPDIHKVHAIHAFPLSNADSVIIDINRALSSKTHEETIDLNVIICEWCGEKLPPHGVARFSHLKKHVNQLVIKKLLSQEQANSINKLKLEDHILSVFKNYFNK